MRKGKSEKEAMGWDCNEAGRVGAEQAWKGDKLNLIQGSTRRRILTDPQNARVLKGLGKGGGASRPPV